MCWICKVEYESRWFRLRRALRRWLRAYASPGEIARKFAASLDPRNLKQWAAMDDAALTDHNEKTGLAFRLEYGLWDDGYPFHRTGGAEATSLSIYRRIRKIARTRTQ